jgi:hypothetical protein
MLEAVEPYPAEKDYWDACNAVARLMMKLKERDCRNGAEKARKALGLLFEADAADGVAIHR